MSYTYMDINNPTHPYRLQDMAVFFSDLGCLEVIQKVLDENGKIRNFPGIAEDERWKRQHRIGQCYDVRFEAQFYSMPQGEYLMLWLIQPSGWYWADDDGFGFNGDSSIMLYSVVDQNGTFTKEFELFSIDCVRYCHDFDEYVK